MNIYKFAVMLPVLVILSLPSANADEFSVAGQTYYMSLKPENINDQEFKFDISTSPKEDDETEFVITVTDGRNPVPAGINGNVYLRRKDVDIMSFECKPETEKGKAVFRFSILTSYIEESTGQVYYRTEEKDGKPGYSVVYRFSLNDFLKRPDPLLKDKPEDE